MEGRRLNEAEIAAALQKLPGWSVQDGKLHKEYAFADFSRAIAFMTAAAMHIQAMDHHPEWSNVYNRVVVDLITHALGGIGTLDVKLAATLDALANAGLK